MLFRSCLAIWAILYAQSVYGQKIQPDAVVNAANSARTVAPGSLATYYGTGLGSGTEYAAATPLPTTLNGASILVNGIAAPLLYASPTQINFQVPYEAVPGTATITVARSGQANTAPEAVMILSAAPGVFSGAGGYAVAQNQDYSVNGPSRAAKPGSVLTAYFTGLGPVTNQPLTGSPASLSVLSYPVAPTTISVAIGDSPAQVLFAGLAPGLTGVAQTNIVVPNLPAGEFPLSLKIGSLEDKTTIVVVGQTVLLPAGSGRIPLVHIDTPAGGSLVANSVVVSGWAINVDSAGDDPVTSVRVQANGQTTYASYGIPRPDVCALYPGRPNCPNVGFKVELPISLFSPFTSNKISVLANDTSTPPLTGSSEVDFAVQANLTVVPNPADVSIGGSQLLIANRSVYWSKPALGTLIVNPTSPISNTLPAGTALYQAPFQLTGAVDTLTVTDAADPTQKSSITINLARVASLRISQTHLGNFTRGKPGTFTIIVSNQSSAAPTAGVVMVSDLFPSDLTLVSIAGPGWSCSGAMCTRNDVLIPGSSYPPLTVQVNVSATAASLLIPQVTVSGGGSPPNSAVDSVIVQ